MKRLMIGALLAAQLPIAAQPARAAELEANTDQRMGAFGGFRLRLPLGGEVRERQLRAGLTLAPVMHGRLASGETRLRIGEGAEFGLRGREPLRLTLAGQDVLRFGAQGDGERRRGLPTGAWIAGGLVLAALIVVGVSAAVLDDARDSPS